MNDEHAPAADEDATASKNELAAVKEKSDEMERINNRELQGKIAALEKQQCADTPQAAAMIDNALLQHRLEQRLISDHPAAPAHCSRS